MSMPFDPAPYFRVPKQDVPGSLGLANSLKSAAPNNLSKGTKAALKEVGKTAAVVKKGWDANKKSGKGKGNAANVADKAVDRAWGALDSRLSGWTRLPADRYPRAAEAAELEQTLFPDGLGFLKLPYAKEWAESERLLNLIDSDKLAGKLDELCGKEFLAEVRRAHGIYGEVLGITSEKDADPEVVKMNGPLLALAEAMRRYLVKVIADLDTGKDADLKLLRKALRPIDDVREGAANRARAAKSQAKKKAKKQAEKQSQPKTA